MSRGAALLKFGLLRTRFVFVALLLLLPEGALCFSTGAFSITQRGRRHEFRFSHTPIVLYMSDGGGEGVSKALNILRDSAKLMKELDSRQVDEKEAEEELQREEAIREKDRENEKKGKENQSREDKVNNDNHDDDSSLSEDGNTGIPDAIEKIVQAKVDAFQARAKKTQILLLKKIAGWAFDKCDTNQNGRIDPADFYMGVLLVHLHLAKYVGVAACHPPTRDQMHELFELADEDHNGRLCKQEFTNAVVVACAPITSRIAVYWSLLGLLPLVVGRFMGGLSHVLRGNIATMSPSLAKKTLAFLEWGFENCVAIFFFSILVPNIFSRIDTASRRYARKRSHRRRSTDLWWLRMPKLPTDPKLESWPYWFTSTKRKRK